MCSAGVAGLMSTGCISVSLGTGVWECLCVCVCVSLCFGKHSVDTFEPILLIFGCFATGQEESLSNCSIVVKIFLNVQNVNQ